MHEARRAAVAIRFALQSANTFFNFYNEQRLICRDNTSSFCRLMEVDLYSNGYREAYNCMCEAKAYIASIAETKGGRSLMMAILAAMEDLPKFSSIEGDADPDLRYKHYFDYLDKAHNFTQGGDILINVALELEAIATISEARSASH
jgi:hypothetical protein